MQFHVCTAAAFLGGNFRVGLEDNLSLEKNYPAKSNAEQVEKMAEILKHFSFEIATPQETRKKMGLI